MTVLIALIICFALVHEAYPYDKQVLPLDTSIEKQADKLNLLVNPDDPIAALLAARLPEYTARDPDDFMNNIGKGWSLFIGITTRDAPAGAIKTYRAVNPDKSYKVTFTTAAGVDYINGADYHTIDTNANRVIVERHWYDTFAFMGLVVISVFALIVSIMLIPLWLSDRKRKAAQATGG